ncbi:hypothetical protein U2A4042300003 [Corynebacterium striatum]|nr:hypothetical protein U2A4042300003 [Corynebacterium striatum]
MQFPGETDFRPPNTWIWLWITIAAL